MQTKFCHAAASTAARGLERSDSVTFNVVTRASVMLLQQILVGDKQELNLIINLAAQRELASVKLS